MTRKVILLAVIMADMAVNKFCQHAILEFIEHLEEILAISIQREWHQDIWYI